jgi:hypothetical protein
VNTFCWHRPGPIKSGTVTCRYCYIGIDRCPCTNSFTWRQIDDHCRCCGGSGWVGIVRSQQAKFREYIESQT